MVLSDGWSRLGELQQVQKYVYLTNKKVTPSNGGDLHYDLGSQHGKQDAIRFFLEVLPKRIGIDLKNIEAKGHREDSPEG